MNFDRINLSRRHLLKAVGAGVVASATSACSSSQPQPPAGIIGADGKRVLPWKNWSGNQSCQPTERLVPRNEEQLIDAIKAANSTVRCVGSGHSFSGLVPTNQTLLSLARLRGVENVDREALEADVWAGTRLSMLGRELWKHDMSTINMSDIDSQSFAGAIATSTHGTGKHLGSISSHLRGLRMVKANGEVIECSPDNNSDLFYASSNHIGAMGVITKARLKTDPAYYLKETSWMMSEEEGLARAAELRDKHRHYEMFALPHSDYMLGVAIDKVAAADIPANPPVPSGDAYEAFRMMSNLIDYMPFMRSWLVNFGASGVEPETRYGKSHEIFGNLRDILFNEMEYVVPADAGPACLKEVLDTIKQQNIPVIFPIEARYVAADEVWLSPFYRRDGFAISCHNFHDKDYKAYFAAIEPIFWKYDGRPHWGKIHTLGPEQLAGKYERFKDFVELRREMDPDGRFINEHLSRVLGV
ncbi:hypothetical protein CHH28_19295 [Bacterioplanes sanyensis]|uniref:FAD-binding PCMH-type domain-containing protein n=1 Tax=Bacterioplanes sanyensis TaxID=1249553 RepID=A0A222FQK4_9GAMM|nr:D-arabinono-1,4-lactone oxidase [Bacterioplanes sanyensis]ASP40681.1 hypothetical protein CHH28_19295 [Bacterioplanes sanyensis]